MNWNLFASTFSLIFLAELPDKTAFATLMLAGEGKLPALFIGAAFAFLIHVVLAVTVGEYLGLLPSGWIKFGSGILFLIFATMSLKRARSSENTGSPSQEKALNLGFFQAFAKTFVVIFIAEAGDLTQLATASLTAKYHDKISILAGSVTALWSVTFIALLLGKKLQGSLSPKKINVLVSIVLGVTGIYFLAEALL